MQDVTRFLDAEFGIDRHHDRADPRERKQHENVPVAVATQYAHAVALADAACRQRTRDRVERCAEFVPAPGLAAGQHPGTLRLARRPT